MIKVELKCFLRDLTYLYRFFALNICDSYLLMQALQFELVNDNYPHPIQILYPCKRTVSIAVPIGSNP